MDFQSFLQHLFGFIGICTVINWIRILYTYVIKPKNPIIITEEDLYELRSKSLCDNCESSDLSLLRSINIKKCTSCGHEMNWNLDPGQLPLVRSNRMVKRNDS